MTAATSPPPVVRPLGRCDLDPLAELLGETLGPRWSTKAVCQELERRDAWSLGAFGERGELLAAALGWQVLDEAEVVAVATQPNARRRGLARGLLEEALLRLGRQGCRAVYLEVEEDNLAARRLYEALGFEVHGRRPGYYGPGRDAVLMGRALPGIPPPPGERIEGRGK